MRLTDKQVEEIWDRELASTIGPWKADGPDYDGWLICSTGNGDDGNDYHVCTDGVHGSDLDGDAKADAEFIACAKRYIPALLSDRAALVKIVEGLAEFGSPYRSTAFGRRCLFCGIPSVDDHNPDCPYRLACEYVEGATPPASSARAGGAQDPQ